MQLYLPLAELPVNILLILGMALAVGFISGMFGVGGGFLITPLLIFIGIPPAVAVASVSGQIAASSLSGALSYARKKQVDFELAMVLVGGGLLGSGLGVYSFALLRMAGQLDLFIALSYVILLGGIGTMMLIESSRVLLREKFGHHVAPPRRSGQRYFANLPFVVKFHRSHLAISIIPVIVIGFVVGYLGSVMGIGGAFILVPALVYLLRVPTAMVIGTTSVQTVITMLVTVILHAVMNHSVDIILAFLLMIGGGIGAQFGSRAGLAMRGEALRLLLGLLILAVGLRFLIQLVLVPGEPFSLDGLR